MGVQRSDSLASVGDNPEGSSVHVVASCFHRCVGPDIHLLKPLLRFPSQEMFPRELHLARIGAKTTEESRF